MTRAYTHMARETHFGVQRTDKKDTWTGGVHVMNKTPILGGFMHILVDFGFFGLESPSWSRYEQSTSQDVLGHHEKNTRKGPVSNLEPIPPSLGVVSLDYAFFAFFLHIYRREHQKRWILPLFDGTG